MHELIVREDWHAAMERAHSHAEELREQDASRGTLPIHESCVCGSPLRLIRTLVEPFPEGLDMTDNWGRTPLEAAVRNGRASADVLAFLRADLKPLLAAADQRDWTKLAALQNSERAGWVAALAAERGASAEVADELCEGLGPANLPELIEARLWDSLASRSEQLISREACAVQDAERRFPVEAAAAAGAPAEVVAKLTAASPPAILFHAIERKHWVRSMELAGLNPAWARQRENGALPAHAGAQHGAPLQLMWQVVEPYPECLSIKDQRDRTPLEVATRSYRSSGQIEDKSSRERSQEVISFLTHYPPMLEAAKRQDWNVLAGFQRQARASWVVGIAAAHGALPQISDGLCQDLSLRDVIEAEAWEPLMRCAEQMVTEGACRTHDAQGEYPLQVAISMGAPSGVLAALREASAGSAEALAHAALCAVSARQWNLLTELELLSPAGLQLAQTAATLRVQLEQETAAKEVAEAQKEAALAREEAALGRERALEAELAVLRARLGGD